MTFEMVTFGSGPFKNWTGKKNDKKNLKIVFIYLKIIKSILYNGF